MRQRADLPESAHGPDAGDDATAQPWPREATGAQRRREAEVAQAQATLKRELVRVYAQACGADKPKR